MGEAPLALALSRWSSVEAMPPHKAAG